MVRARMNWLNVLLVALVGCADTTSLDEDVSAAQSPLLDTTTRWVSLTGEGRWRLERGVDLSGRIETRVYDAFGRSASLEELRRVRDNSRRRDVMNGRAMSPQLRARVATTPIAERLPIRGWLALPAVVPPRPPRPGVGDPVAEIESAISTALSAAEALLSSDDEFLVQVGNTPRIHGLVRAGTAERLGRSGLFMRLSLQHPPLAPEARPTLSTSWYYATESNDAFVTGWDGTGQKIAVNEWCFPDDITYLPNITWTYSAATCMHSHPRKVAGLIANTYVNKGSARNADILIANEPYANVWYALNAAILNGANTVNTSVPLDSCTDDGGSIDDDSLYRDWATLFKIESYQDHLPLFVAGGGNNCEGSTDPNDHFVRNRFYNGIIVGGTDDQGTNTVADDTAWSSWRNPTSPSGDRELPELVAPGWDVTSAATAGGGDAVGTGTSYSTPIVSGIAALTTQRAGYLRWWPEVRKAIVLASPDHDIHGGWLDLNDPDDEKDGAGLVDAWQTAYLSGFDSSGSSNGGTAGYDYGYMDFGSDFVNGMWSRRITVSSGASGCMRVVLTWDATPTCNFGNGQPFCTGHGPDADLNLLVVDSATGSPVSWSYSFDNNYEITLPNLAPWTTYEIQVFMWDPRTTGTWYGLAWRTMDSCT